MSDMERIVTIDGDEYMVTATNRRGDPLHVIHAEPYLRGSFVEWSMNSALGIYNVKVELRASLPSWLKRMVPEPQLFWAPVYKHPDDPHPK